jgi:hypothetical protein
MARQQADAGLEMAASFRHQIARLGTFKRIALSRGLPATTAQQQGDQNQYARQLHIQFPLTVFKENYYNSRN